MRCVEETLRFRCEGFAGRVQMTAKTILAVALDLVDWVTDFYKIQNNNETKQKFLLTMTAVPLYCKIVLSIALMKEHHSYFKRCMKWF